MRPERLLDKGNRCCLSYYIISTDTISILPTKQKKNIYSPCSKMKPLLSYNGFFHLYKKIFDYDDDEQYYHRCNNKEKNTIKDGYVQTKDIDG